MSSLFMVTALLGCADTTEPADSGPVEGAVQLTDANNYQSMSALSIPVVETMPGADLRVCFDQVAKDIQCHNLNPSVDIDNVALLRFTNATPEQVQQKLVATKLVGTDYDVYRDINTVDGETCVQTANMELFGSGIQLETDYKESAADTYMLLFTRGTDPGLGALTMVFVKPVATSTNTRVDAFTGCAADEMSGLLEFQANLQGATPVVVPAGTTAIDWSELTRDGGGGDIAGATIDRVLIGFYQGKTVADLEAQIFDLEQPPTDGGFATNIWEMFITGGESADLSLATERTSQAPFTGFDRTDGVWIIALMCSMCQNPSPIVLSVVQPG